MSGDPSQSQQQQQQEIITVAHERPHMSIDELLKVIKEANGMPVLFVPSGDGRLAAVAVDGLQNLVPAAKESDEKKQQDLRGWLVIVTSLIATVTFTAGLTPPGGFWAADDGANKYIAGTPVIRDKFPMRYKIFYYSNTTAFLTSLMLIGVLAKNKNSNSRTNTVIRMERYFYNCNVVFCFLGLATSYISGSTDSLRLSIYAITTVIAYIVWSLWFFSLDRMG